MIACIVPGDLYAEENISTLAYASKVSKLISWILKGNNNH
jgi:hypothetical protein